MTISMQQEPFRVEQVTPASGGANKSNCLQWSDEAIDLRQVFTIVEWCLNIEWLFHHCDITDSQRLELGEAAEAWLTQTHQHVVPEQDPASGKPKVIVSNGLKTIPGLKNNKIAPEYTEQQALRDMCKWKYQLCTGKQYSWRNRGARRGYAQFLNLYTRLYETIETGTTKEHVIASPLCDVSWVAKDLNELLWWTAKGRHDCDAVTAFCVKVLDQDVLKRMKMFVDECQVL